MVNPPEKLIAILGPTGMGKSEIAVALAALVNGEVVNSDAFQLYAGLEMLDNKQDVTPPKKHGNIPL